MTSSIRAAKKSDFNPICRLVAQTWAVRTCPVEEYEKIYPERVSFFYIFIYNLHPAIDIPDKYPQNASEEKIDFPIRPLR
jgi:hypothetical protein